MVALTSTSPSRLAARWLDLPRSGKARRLPSVRKANGQLWINWDVAFRTISPYVNAGWGAVTGRPLLSLSRDVAAQLADALVTAKAGYAGLSLEHQGPVPVGALLVPTLVGMALEPDERGGSDVARERLACQRLKVLHHHAKLFRADIGRWPAELSELEGYVDFAGNPRLLMLEVSTKRRWSEWFNRLSGGDRDKEQKDELNDSPAAEVKTKHFVIEWAKDSWRLGVTPGAL